ncbi:hypothetical protein AAVH_42519, partial [Aphelenchoides avenae]
MKRQRLFGERQSRNHSQSSNFQSLMRKELYVWSEEHHQVQRVNVNQKALQHCLRNGKDPLISSKGAGNNAGSASTRDQDGLRYGERLHRGGLSGGGLRGRQNDTSREDAVRNTKTYLLPIIEQLHRQRRAEQCDNDRQKFSRGGRSRYFNGNDQTGHAARRQTSNQQSGLAISTYDRPQHNRGSVHGNTSAKRRPRRSRNAIEVVEALNDSDQKALLHSKVGMLVNKRFEVQQMLDQGSYGQIFIGFDHLDLRKVAVKFDEGKRKAERTSSSKRNHLKDEYDIYTTIR